MRLSSPVLTLFIIVEAALTLGSTPVESEDGLTNVRAKRQDAEAKYSKHWAHPKSKRRYYKDKVTADVKDVNFAEPAAYVPTSHRRRTNPKRKMAPSSDRAEQNALNSQDKSRSKLNWNEIVHQINAITKSTDKDASLLKGADEEAIAKPAYPVALSGSPQRQQMRGTAAGGPCCPPLECCPSSLESVFICPKCRAHFIVRTNVRESRCGHCGPPTTACPMREVGAKADALAPSDSKQLVKRLVGCPRPPDCPSTLETMFVCPQCRTHYIFRLNIQMSRCPPCSMDCPASSNVVDEPLEDIKVQAQDEPQHK